jgi:HEAT repeat protein
MMLVEEVEAPVPEFETGLPAAPITDLLRPSLEELVEAICHTELGPACRWRAVRSLGQTGDPAAVPVLEELLKDPEPTIQNMAAVSLRRLQARLS